MSIIPRIKNNSSLKIEKQIKRECKKFEKYFFVIPEMDCKILTFKNAHCVKMSLNSGVKKFSGTASGARVDVCINKAAKRLERMIINDKDTSLKRGHPVSYCKWGYENDNRDRI